MIATLLSSNRQSDLTTFHHKRGGFVKAFSRIIEKTAPPVLHAILFLRRQVIDEFGMDYDYWLRIGRKYSAHYVPAVNVRIIRASTRSSGSS